MGSHERAAADRRLIAQSARRWRAALAVVATALLCLAIGTGPARAEWPQEYWFSQWDIHNAWTLSKGAGVTVAVVDSGVVASLGDLAGQVLPGVDLSGQGTNGQSDPGSDCDAPGGCYSHGTQMALLIAGTGAGKGFQGVAPEAKILPVKVATSTDVPIDASRAAQGIRWAVDHGATVIDLSFGSVSLCDPVDGAAIKYAYQHNVIVVAATGNSAGPVSSPANCPGALAISGVDHLSKPWPDSNTGPEVAFASSAAATTQETLNGTQLFNASGTSDAAAIVSGEFALLRSHFPHASARDIVTMALHTLHNGIGAKNFGKRVDDQIGYGLILPYQALKVSVPATASNPIYDAWATQLGPATPNAATSAPTSPGAATSAPTEPNPPPATPTPPAASGHGGSSSAGLVIGIVVAVVVVLAVAVVLVVRRRRSGAAAGAGR